VAVLVYQTSCLSPIASAMMFASVTCWPVSSPTLNHEFSAADEALIDKLVVPGHPSTPGYNDPQYALLGRPV